jgi:hypothetical protein
MKAFLSTFQMLLALSAGATSITPVIESSSVAISGTANYYPGYPLTGSTVSMSYSASTPAKMQTPFNATVSDSAILPPLGGGPPWGVTAASSSASQVSSVSGMHIEANGSVGTYAASLGGLEGRPNGHSEAASVFDFIFFLSESATYQMSGSLGAGDGGVSPDVASITLSLLGNHAPLLDIGQIYPAVILLPPGAWGYSFNLNGLLEPGTYRITGIATAASSGGFYEGDSGRAGFAFTMDFDSANASVPDRGSTGGLLMGALVILLLWRGRANRRALRQCPC